MTSVRFLEALRTAVRDEMARDERILYLGEDVVQSLRGVSTGLADLFGQDRVLDTPVSEQAFTGFATGAALGGFRPIVEFQIPSLAFLAFEQITNQAQKFSLMSGGQASVPVTYIVPGSGARRGLAAQHSDNPYTYFAHAGVKTVVPSSPSDAYGLAVSAIRDDDPVIVFAPAAALPLRGELSPGAGGIPLGVGQIRKEGHDVTVVAVGHLVGDALALADRLSPDVSVEVLDPRTIYPLDGELLCESAAKTGRLVVFDDAGRSAGFAAEVVATVSERLGAGIVARRVTRADSPIPFALELESAVLPSVVALERAIGEVLALAPAR